jgi:anti-sigma B factor antagonist
MATLKVQGEDHGAIATLRLTGEFDMAGELAFESELQSLLAGEPTTVLVDLRSLSFLDSSGLRALIRARTRSRREGWDLALTRAPRAVDRIFKLTRTDRIFRVVKEPDRATNGASSDGTWELPHVEDLTQSEVRRPRFTWQEW